MAFVERGWRSFLRTGDPDPTVWRGRMAGQLMTYEACKDPRAWCLSAHDRRQHLIDIMRRGPDDLDGTLALPTEAVVRREPPIQRKRPEIKPPPTPAAAPPPPKTPPQEAEQPQDAHVAFAEEEKPTVAEAPTPTEVTESEETAEAPEPPGKTAKERAGDFCMSLSGLANELDGMLRSKSVCQMVPRLYEICKELSDLATECASLQSQMSRRTTEAESLVEAARAATDTDLMEEFVEDYDSFDTTRFITDIAQVRMLEDKLNDMRLEGMEDDADEADETWQLRNIVAELENRLDYSKDEAGMPVRRAEDFSQTEYASQGSEGGRSYEPSEASSREFLTPEQRECDELRATIENLQRRIEILESEKHDVRGRDTYEDREAANLRDQLHSLTAERDNLVNQLNQAKMEAEALKQENAGLLQETEAIRQEMAQLQGEHLAALDYIKSLEEATAECTMMKEENKRMEDKLQQTTREQGKLHHEVHKLQCIIRDVEDDRKRTLNQLERLSYAAEWAKEAEQSLLEKDLKLDAREQEINDLLNTLEEISAEMERCKNIEQSLEERNDALAAQEEEIANLTQKIEELAAELEKLRAANLGLEAERDKLKDIAEECQKTTDSMQSETMGVSDDLLALQQQILSLTEALAKQKEESERLQAELNALKSNISIAAMTIKDEDKLSSAVSVTSVTNSAMRSMLKQARSALSVVMMELEDSAKNMEALVQKNKLLLAENEELQQQLESLGVPRQTPAFKFDMKSEKEETLPRQEVKRINDERDNASEKQSRKSKADEDLDVLRDELKTCKADNEQLLALVSKLTAEGKSRESVKQEALLLQNQLQAERLRYQEMRDSFHKLQTSTENVMKEAAQAAVSDDRLKRMGEVHLLENQYKAQKLETEKLWKLIASLKSDTEKLRNVLPDNFYEVSASMCERDNVSEEMKNVCNQLIAAKEENKRLQDIVENLRRGIDTLQNKLAETNTENENLIMQNLSSSPGNEELKGQADDVSSKLTKFVADYPKQMPDTDSIKELTKEVRCLHEKLVVNITTCNIEAIKEENLRLENLLRERETEIAGMREILSAKGIPVPAHLEVPIEIIKEPRKTDGGQSIDSSYDDTGKKLLSHLVAENVLLKKHLERRATHTTEIVRQLEEENELLKRQLSSEMHIVERVQKDTIQLQQKSIEEIKAPQQQTVDKIGATDVTQQRRRTSFAGKTTENALREQIESLHKQVDDANGVTRGLETAIDELRNTRASLQVTGITEVAPQRGICCKCGKSKRKTETEKDLIGISAEIAETENDKNMRNRIELLERQLSDANSIVKSLQEATSTAETENERNLHNKIEELQSQLNDTNNIVRSLGKMLDEVQNEYKALQVTGVSEVSQEIPGTSTAETDNERILRNQVESLRKQLNDANNMVLSLESTLNELRDETESMQLPIITEVAQQSRGMPAAEPENEKMRNQIESLQKQLNDSNAMIQELQDRVKKLTDENNVLKSKKTKDEVTTSATIKEAGGSPPSSTYPESEKVMKQLTADNESLRKELEEARKYVHKTSDDETKHENMITELKAENELLKKKIEDAREKQSRKYIEDPGSTKIINQMTKENELLRKQVEDLRRAQPRPSSAGTSRDPAFEQLMKDYEAVRERLEDARKNLPVTVTSEPQEATESEDIVKLRTDNEILRKQLEDAWKMAQSTQEQILGDDYTKIIDQLREENDFLKKRLESLTDITSVSSKEVVKYVEKPVEIIKTDTDTEKTITELRNLIESLQSELKDANTAKRELEEQIKKLKEEKQLEPVEIIKADTDTEKTITELRNLNESLQSELKDANTAKRELEEQIKKLKEEKQLEPEKSTKTDEKTLDKDISQLTEQNELLKKQLQDATNTIEDLTKNIDKLKDEIQRLQSTKISGVEDQTQELQKLEAELQELRDENNRLKRENERIRQDVTNLTQTAVPSALILWKTDEQQLESTVDEQKRRIEDLLSKMSKKDHPGDPGEVETWKKERERLLDMINQLRQELKESQEALEEKDEMDARMQSLLSQIAGMKQKLEEQEKELAMGGGAAQDLQEENTKMKNQMDSLNSELENMKQKLKDQEAELGRLTQLQDENSKLKNELDSLKEELERLRAAGQAAEQVQGLTEENEKLKKDMDSLKEELERLRAAEKAAEQVQGLTDENEKLKKELDSLKEELERLRAAGQAAEQVQGLTDENEKLKKELDSLKEELERLRAAEKAAEQVQGLTDENERLKKELDSLKEELERLRAAGQAAEQVQGLTDENERLKKELDSLKDELERLRAAGQAAEQVQGLTDENERLKKELEALKQDMAKLQSAEQAAEQAKSALEENQKLKDENDKLQKELEALRAELDKLKSAQQADQSLLDEINKLKGENEKLKSELEEKVEQMKKLESEAKEAGGKDLSKELEALQEQLKQLQAEKQKLENELKECLEKNKTMEDKIKSLESADAAMKALQDELEALKAENKKLAEGGGGAPDAKKLKELEDECEAKLAALRAEHQKELERRDQVHRENLETCQMELNELKKKLQESDKTLQLNLDKDKNKAEDAKEYEDEIARLQKQSEMLAKNLKADLEAKNAELDKLRFEMTKENNDLKKQLEKCMADCEKYKKELEKMSGAPVKAVSSKKSTARVDKTKSEPLPTVKEETSEKKDKEKKDKEKKEKKDKEKKDKEKKEKKPKEESDEAPATDKVPKKAEGAAKKKGGPASKGDGKPDTTSKSKLEESVPEGGKKGDGGVCRCMEHPLVKIIYKILHGGTEVLSTEDIVYLHKKLCAECRTALGPPRNEAQVRAHMRMLRKEIVEREEKMNKEVAQLEESLHEGKLFLERLYERYTEKRKAAQEAIQNKKMAPTHPQACSARRTASGTAIGSRNQPWMAPSNRPADQTGVAKMTVRCPG